MTIAEMRLPPNVDDKRHIALQSKCAVFLLNRKQYETLSYATQSENKILFSKEKSSFSYSTKNKIA